MYELVVDIGDSQPSQNNLARITVDCVMVSGIVYRLSPPVGSGSLPVVE